MHIVWCYFDALWVSRCTCWIGNEDFWVRNSGDCRVNNYANFCGEKLIESFKNVRMKESIIIEIVGDDRICCILTLSNRSVKDINYFWRNVEINGVIVISITSIIITTSVFHLKSERELMLLIDIPFSKVDWYLKAENCHGKLIELKWIKNNFYLVQWVRPARM